MDEQGSEFVDELNQWFKYRIELVKGRRKEGRKVEEGLYTLST